MHKNSVKINNRSTNTPLTVIYHNENILVVQTQTFFYREEEESTEYLTKPVHEKKRHKPAVDMVIRNQPSYGQFNLGLHVADNPSEVLINRCQLVSELNNITHQSVHAVHWLNQVHGNTVVDVDTQPFAIQPIDADALTTTQKGAALAIMTADCVPIMLFCQTTGRVAAIHAGWQGLANGVIATTVKNFVANSKIFGQSDKLAMTNIQAWVGACISIDNYEVNTEVLEKLVEGTMINFTNINKQELIQKITKSHKQKDKVWIDLPKLATLQLHALGATVMTKDIPCSYADTFYYSHRRATHNEQGHTGRMAMIICRLN